MQAVLELHGVSKSFGVNGEVPVLRGIDIEIGEGEFLAVCGRSGSGKSTLLNLLGLLSQPTSGTVRVLGEQIVDMSQASLCSVRRSHIGFIFQRFHLLGDRSLVENVELALTHAGWPRTQRRAAALDALETVGLADIADRDTRLLSGGEQQRAAVARAIVKRPRIILADEPTGNLDSANEERVLELLMGLRTTGSALVLVTHDDTVANRAQRRVNIHDGRLS